MLGLPGNGKYISTDHNFQSNNFLLGDTVRQRFKHPENDTLLIQNSNWSILKFLIWEDLLGRSRNFSVASEETIQVRDTLIILEDITLVMVNYADKKSK